MMNVVESHQEVSYAAVMSSIVLKPRQEAAYEAIMQRYAEGINRQLVSLPTGVGKTILAAYLAGDFKKTLIAVPTLELMAQTEAAIRRVHPFASIARFHGAGDSVDADFVVSTIATLNRRLESISRDEFDLVIVDETHHARATTWERVINYFEPKLLVGLTATPERTDGLALSDIYDEVSYEMTLKDAVLEEYLAEPLGVQVSSREDLDEVRITAGDFSQGDLGSTVNTPARNELIVDSWEEYGCGRRTLVFTVTIDHAKAVAAAFEARGVKAAWVSGADPQREEKLAQYARGEIQVLTNCSLLVEGFDDPATSCIIMARPTKSRVWYAQACGRGLRLHPNKADCVIIDVVDNSRRHRLVNIWEFWGSPVPTARKGLVSLRAVDAERDEELVRTAEGIVGSRVKLDVVTKLVDLLEPLPQLEGECGVRSGDQPAHVNALRMLLQYGFNVFEGLWTVRAANHALKVAMHSGRQRNPGVLASISW